MISVEVAIWHPPALLGMEMTVNLRRRSPAAAFEPLVKSQSCQPVLGWSDRKVTSRKAANPLKRRRWEAPELNSS